MATLWIREYKRVGVDPSNAVGATPIAREPGTDQTPLTFSASQASAAFDDGTRYIGIIADADFHYEVGADPTATTGSFKLPANMPHFIGVSPGHKIAAIAAA